jgi:hypothetical protein
MSTDSQLLASFASYRTISQDRVERQHYWTGRKGLDPLLRTESETHREAANEARTIL